jgi:hypothetical protein
MKPILALQKFEPRTSDRCVNLQSPNRFAFDIRQKNIVVVDVDDLKVRTHHKRSFLHGQNIRDLKVIDDSLFAFIRTLFYYRMLDTVR